MAPVAGAVLDPNIPVNPDQTFEAASEAVSAIDFSDVFFTGAPVATYDVDGDVDCVVICISSDII